MTDARLRIDVTDPIAPIPRRLFGSFLEHLGRAIYTGIYEPGHPSADSAGFRRDVIDLVRELGVSTVRYPGGNFVSGFRWEDSVGPVADRPRRLDLAWHSLETNEIGLHEFSDWLRRIDGTLMMAVNLGTRGTAEALDLLEYANAPAGSARSDLRGANGHAEPFDVRMWCLGNEMDGPWQVGHRDADSYGRLAAQTASAMRMLDENLELVVCGSSNSHMPTFGTWERTVLSHTFDLVDYISCHAYYQEHDGDLDSFLACATDMDSFISNVSSTIDHVRAAKNSTHRVAISFDEWNIWYNDKFEHHDRITGIGNWPVAPRLLEDVYTVADAAVFGSLLISLINHCDRVTSASLAQLVNVIAPIMTEPGGSCWRQTTFYPFAEASHLARGQAVRTSIDAPTMSSCDYGAVPIVTAAASAQTETGTGAIFVVNRSAGETPLAVSGPGLAAPRRASTLWDADVRACNTVEQPERVVPQVNSSLRPAVEGFTIELPPCSWTAIELG